MDVSERSYAVILSCPLALVKLCVTSPIATAGETDIMKR